MAGPATTTFLLGAGVSIPAGMPSTRDISDRLNAWKDVGYTSAGTFTFNSAVAATHSREYSDRAKAFLDVMCEEVAAYFAAASIRRAVNYEDVLNLSVQVRDTLMGEFEEPALHRLITSLGPRLSGYLGKGVIRDDWRLHEVAIVACDALVDLVVEMLSAPVPRPLNHLGVLEQALVNAPATTLDVFTLNHDCLIEEFGVERRILVATGFGTPISGFARWHTGGLDGSGARIRLLKLHGSVNWFWFVDPAVPGIDVYGSVTPGTDPFHIRNAAGQPMDPAPARPNVLVGTFRKIQDYSMSANMTELHCRFYARLNASERLVVSGFGFGDKAINSHLIDWMSLGGGRRIVVVDPRTTSEIRESARPAIDRYWNRWGAEKSVHHVKKSFADVSWADLASL